MQRHKKTAALMRAFRHLGSPIIVVTAMLWTAPGWERITAAPAKMAK